MDLKKLINSTNVELQSIQIVGFGRISEDIRILIELLIDNKAHVTTFYGVTALNIDRSNYVINKWTKILVDDIGDYQIEGASYSVSINGDALTFYCCSFDVSESTPNQI